MSDSAPTYTVTLAQGTAETEGSLAWALTQVNAYTGEGTPTIAFAAELGGGSVAMDGFFEPTRDVRLVNLGTQQVWGAPTIIREGVRVTIGSGVALSQVNIYGTLECEEGAVLDGLVFLEYDAVSPTLVMNGTRVEWNIQIGSPGARIEGSGNTFTEQCPFVFQKFSDVSVVLAGLTDSQFEAGEYYVELGQCSGGVLPLLSGDFKGYKLMQSTFYVLEEGTLTLAEGVDLYTEIYVYGSASQPDLYFEEVRLAGNFVFEGNNNIYVLNSSTQTPFSKGIVLFTTPSDLSGSSSTLTNPGNVTVHGRVELDSQVELVGYTGSFLGPDTTPPELSFLDPQIQKVEEGKSSVTLGWEASADAVRYELKVDGKSVYKGTESSYSLTLKDGVHRYTVTAWDEAGNHATAEGESFTLDATAPVVSLKTPQMERPGDGTTRVTLSWTANENASYLLTVGEETVTPEGNSHTFTLQDGEYSYTLTATDEADNSCTLRGRFFCDSTAPALSMAEPELTAAGKGKTKVLFCWSGEAGSTYALYVDNKKVYSGSKGSYSLSLVDGRHSYTLVATDAAGNATQLEGTVVTDATAPTVTLLTPSLSKAAEGRINVTLNWSANEPASYMVQVDDGAVYQVVSLSFSLPYELADGKHNYTVTATDTMGNSSITKGSFSYDASAPGLTLNAPTLKKVGEGLVRATLKWKGERGSSYRVCVDDDPTLTYEGKSTSCTFTLEDGEHSYSITATDANGNSCTQTGSFFFDATAPELELLDPELSKAGTGKIYATLSWEGSGAESYTLKVDGRKQYEGEGTQCSLELKDGTHKYTITAIDAAGNKVTREGSFALDSTPPRLSVKKPKLSKVGQGQINALFSWSTESGTTSRLIVDGVERYSGSASSCQLQLEGDKHSYYVEVCDAAGNTTRSEEAALELDTTNPLVVLDGLTGVISGSSVLTSFSWQGETGVSYTVKIDHKKVMSGKNLSFSTKLTPGDHHCSITAKDAAGNSTTFTTTLRVDALGAVPVISASGAVRELSWQEGEQAGISEQVGWGNSADSYCFRLEEDSTLTLKISGLESPANLYLMRSYGLGVVEQQERISMTADGIDRELNLSAGTYYLQVEACDASLVEYDTTYLLNLELNSPDGKKQAVLAAGS